MSLQILIEVIVRKVETATIKVFLDGYSGAHFIACSHFIGCTLCELELHVSLLLQFSFWLKKCPSYYSTCNYVNRHSPMMEFFDKILLSDEVFNKMNIFSFIFEKNKIWSKNLKIFFRQFKLTLEGGYKLLLFFFKKSV